MPQGKEIQQHLQANALRDIAVVKFFLSRFVVRHPKESARGILPQVHPVHKAPQNRGHGGIGNGNGGHLPSLAEGHLKAHRLKCGGVKLLPQLLHDHIQLPVVPLK